MIGQRRLLHGAILAACLSMCIPSARADVAPEATPSSTEPLGQPSSLEVWLTAGPSVVFGEPANPEYAQSLRRVGGLVEAGVAYRSSYFVDPFLSVAYASLASGESHLPGGPWGASGTMEQQLGAWVIAPGITSDIWRFRLRFGLGLAVVMQSFRFLGQTNSSTQLPLASQLGIGFNAFESYRFRLDAETRIVLASGADISFVAVAVVARSDLLLFGR
jgi:hypothetical protein